MLSLFLEMFSRFFAFVIFVVSVECGEIIIRYYTGLQGTFYLEFYFTLELGYVYTIAKPLWDETYWEWQEDNKLTWNGTPRDALHDVKCDSWTRRLNLTFYAFYMTLNHIMLSIGIFTFKCKSKKKWSKTPEVL